MDHAVKAKSTQVNSILARPWHKQGAAVSQRNQLKQTQVWAASKRFCTSSMTCQQKSLGLRAKTQVVSFLPGHPEGLPTKRRSGQEGHWKMNGCKTGGAKLCLQDQLETIDTTRIALQDPGSD